MNNKKGGEMATLSKQIWYCEGCRGVGAIMVENISDVKHETSLVGDNHRKVSPQCLGRKLKIYHPNQNTLDTNQLPLWAKSKIRILMQI